MRRPRARLPYGLVTPVPGVVPAERSVGRPARARPTARGARHRVGRPGRSLRRLVAAGEPVVRVVDDADRAGRRDDVDQAGDLGDPDRPAQPGDVRAPGADARPRVGRPARDRSRDRDDVRPLIQDDRGARLGTRRASGQIRRVPRDRRPAAARRGNDVQRPVLRRPASDDEPPPGPDPATAAHGGCPRPGHDSPRGAPGRYLEQHVVPRVVRGPARRDPRADGGDDGRLRGGRA